MNLWNKAKPVMGHVTAVAAILFALNADAQTTPTAPAQSPDGGTMDSPPPRHDRATDADAPQHQGWQRFDERTSAELELREDQQERLRDIDARYDREFQALGEDPMANPRYNELNERRNEEVREILDEEQFERWNERNPERR
jgi:hypothetical protein